MKHIVNAKNTTVTPAIREYVEKKFEKLEKYIQEKDIDVHTMIEVKDGGKRHKVEVTIPIGKDIVRAEVNHTDMYAAIDEAEKVAARRLRKRKEKLTDRYQKKTRPDKVAEVDETELEELIAEPEITREKVHEMRILTAKQAIDAMDMLGHSFYVYMDIDCEGRSCAVYKKEDGTYGHIEYTRYE